MENGKEEILIFGKGKYFKEKKKDIESKFIIAGFIDNSVSEKHIDDIYGVDIYNPSDYGKLPDLPIYCISADFIGMWKQLVDIGVNERRIRFGYEFSPLQEGVECAGFGCGEKLVSEKGVLFYEINNGEKICISNLDSLKLAIREKTAMKNESIGLIKKLDTIPISRTFGSERGKAVDRYYIELFLSENEEAIKGTVLEIANNQYTLMFGKEKVEKSVISHVKGWGENSILCNFETGEGVVNERYDCIICTQTLQYIYDLESAIKNIYRMLKLGGTALITVPGIKPLCRYDNENWGEKWSFTEESMRLLCDCIKGSINYEIVQYGNVKTATAYLYGLCVEELDANDFLINDQQYPFLICVKIVKGK